MKTTFLLSAFVLFSGLVTLGQSPWTYASLSESKGGMGSTSLGNKAYFAGGYNNSGPLNKVETYDVITQEWKNTDHLSISRTYPVGVTCGSKIFFAGGVNFSTQTVYSTVDIYDTVTKQWTVGQLSKPRFDLEVLSHGNKVLFAGGVEFPFTTFNIVDIYDCQTGIWSTSTLSQARCSMASAVVGDLAIFAGGFTGNNISTNRVDIYNFTTNTWSTATLSQARAAASATAFGDKVLIAGGVTNANIPTDRVDIYNKLSGTWSTANLSTKRAWQENAATVDGKAYFAGGGIWGSIGARYGWYSPSDVIDIYDSATGEWTIDFLSHQYNEHSVVGVGNYLIIAGGINENGNFVPTVEIFFIPVGISSFPANNSYMKVYPNPATETITIEFPGSGHNLDGITHIYGIDGREVMCQNATGLKSEIDITDLTPGLYFIKLISNNKIGAGKFVKN
jgi:hypothetical protein